jgi:hypothetical protein
VLSGDKIAGVTVLGYLLDFAVTDAGRAHADALSGAFDHCPHRLQIDVPAALGHIVGVADAAAELRPASTDIANSCHKTEIS